MKLSSGWLFKKKDFYFTYLYVCGYVHVSSGAHRGQNQWILNLESECVCVCVCESLCLLEHTAMETGLGLGILGHLECWHG
jgi:pheromone shutdown protein TraB